MTSHFRISSRAPLALLALALGGAACAGNRRDPIVPEDMQQRSKERYGEQQMSMESLNQTPAEQASSFHHRDTSPSVREDAEDPDGRDSGD